MDLFSTFWISTSAQEIPTSPSQRFSLWQDRRTTTGPDAFDYVIVDESHHAMAPHFNNTIAYFEPAFRLGITATPFRHDEKDLKELFGETVYSKNLVSGIVGGSHHQTTKL